MIMNNVSEILQGCKMHAAAFSNFQYVQTLLLVLRNYKNLGPSFP